jgi:hypothetical protein
MKFSVALLPLFLLVASAFALGKNSQNQTPIAWGMLSQNTGCVIFEEGRKTHGAFWGVAVTTKTSGKLTVIEAQNYTLEEKVYLETQENMDALMQRAQKDKVKYVKIPENYTQEQLENARMLCTQNQSQ